MDIRNKKKLKMDHSFVRSPDRGVMRGDSGQRGRKFESLRRIIDSSLILSDPDCIQSQIARKADCTQECHLFIRMKHPPYPFVKPCEILNLAVRHVFLRVFM